MAVDLSDYVDTVRREVAPPGSTTFATVSDNVFVGYLADAFWEVKLDGFIEPFVCDPSGIVISQDNAQATDPQSGFTVTPYVDGVDMPRDQVALVCLYAGIKIIRNRLMEQTTRVRAKAGSVEFESDFSANLLIEMLKELQSVRQRLLYLKTFNQDVHLVDAFSARSVSAASYSGYLYDWYAGAFGGSSLDLYNYGDTGIV
jgi:hypothetical protein